MNPRRYRQSPLKVTRPGEGLSVVTDTIRGRSLSATPIRARALRVPALPAWASPRSGYVALCSQCKVRLTKTCAVHHSILLIEQERKLNVFIFYCSWNKWAPTRRLQTTHIYHLMGLRLHRRIYFLAFSRFWSLPTFRSSCPLPLSAKPQLPHTLTDFFLLPKNYFSPQEGNTAPVEKAQSIQTRIIIPKSNLLFVFHPNLSKSPSSVAGQPHTLDGTDSRLKSWPPKKWCREGTHWALNKWAYLLLLYYDSSSRPWKC